MRHCTFSKWPAQRIGAPRVHRKLWVGKANGHSVSLSAGPRPDLLWQREKVMVDGLLRMWSTDGSGLLHALPAVLAFWVQQSAVGVATYSASSGLAPQTKTRTGSRCSC